MPAPSPSLRCSATGTLVEAERIHRRDGSVSFVLYRVIPVQEAGR